MKMNMSIKNRVYFAQIAEYCADRLEGNCLCCSIDTIYCANENILFQMPSVFYCINKDRNTIIIYRRLLQNLSKYN